MNTNLFSTPKMQMDESIELTKANLLTYGSRYKHWAIAFSGGKDSTATVTVVMWLIESGHVPAPESLTVCYADTRMELTPLHLSAIQIGAEITDRAEDWRDRLRCDLRFVRVMAHLDKRFLVYILGRGVPPPNNNTLRWCTRQIKIDPMKEALQALAVKKGVGSVIDGKYRGNGDKLLVLTGVRRGESVARDKRITVSCTTDKAECGQGWFQRDLPEAVSDTLAPLDHWRICHVWAWCWSWAPTSDFGEWSTRLIAEAYGGRDGDEAAEVGARTGCIGCPLTSEDVALDRLLLNPRWTYLTPLKELRHIYRQLREPRNRLRKAGLEKLKDGTTAKNPQRMGPITMRARETALKRILALQDAINVSAKAQSRPLIDLLNIEELQRIQELIAANTWPDKWTGAEPTGDVLMDKVFADGSVQPLLFQV